MNNQKIENLLNLAINVTPTERERSLNLNVGYEPESKTWQIIVKYTGSLDFIKRDFPNVTEVTIVELLNGYAILTVPQYLLPVLASYPEIAYIEKPKQLFFSVNLAISASCISPLYQSPFSTSANTLNGKGIIIGILDSGIDYTHPDFRNSNNTTRILNIWDQTLEIDGKHPTGYIQGSEFSQNDINTALSSPNPFDIVPSRDLSGHGTAVAGIAAGNGSKYRGIAYESSIIAVKLGTPRTDSFPKTTELMQGIDYLIRKSIFYKKPLVINISFGNNYGSHNGNSLLETYINSVSQIGQTTIVIGTGNEGASNTHTVGFFPKQSSQLPTASNTAPKISELLIGTFELNLNVQLWKSYVDNFSISIISPSNREVGPFIPILGPQKFTIDNTKLLVYYGEPSPYSTSQEIYIDFLPTSDYIQSGIWKFKLTPQKIVVGRYDLWLPGSSVIGSETRFLSPDPNTTLTIPSTATYAISVGAYNGLINSYANFSGRGFTRTNNLVKPDIVAPGVNLTSTATGGGYNTFTGTSFATPVVSGSAALLMQWGIIYQNDPFLYGEKLKAYLINGAKKLPEFNSYPNPEVGWGALCLKNSIPSY